MLHSMASSLIAADLHVPLPVEVSVLRGDEIARAAIGAAAPLEDPSRGCMYHHPGWLRVLAEGIAA